VRPLISRFVVCSPLTPVSSHAGGLALGQVGHQGGAGAKVTSAPASFRIGLLPVASSCCLLGDELLLQLPSTSARHRLQLPPNRCSPVLLPWRGRHQAAAHGGGRSTAVGGIRAAAGGSGADPARFARSPEQIHCGKPVRGHALLLRPGASGHWRPEQARAVALLGPSESRRVLLPGPNQSPLAADRRNLHAPRPPSAPGPGDAHQAPLEPKQQATARAHLRNLAGASKFTALAQRLIPGPRGGQGRTELLGMPPGSWDQGQASGRSLDQGGSSVAGASSQQRGAIARKLSGPGRVSAFEIEKAGDRKTPLNPIPAPTPGEPYEQRAEGKGRVGSPRGVRQR